MGRGVLQTQTAQMVRIPVRYHNVVSSSSLARNKKLLFFEFGHVLCLCEKVDLDCPGSKGRILLWTEILLRSDHSVKI